MDLKTYLEREGLTQVDFGLRIGRSGATVSRLARRLQKPDIDMMEAIARATRGAVTVVDFMRLPKGVARGKRGNGG